MNKLSAASLLCVPALAAAAYMDFVFAPEDELQGVVQRIFYLHVSCAIAAYACFAMVLGGSLVYLWRGSLAADRLARAAAPVGLLFTTVTFVMGMIWAKPIWNWDPSKTWDARLTSTAVLWAVYAGYLLVRRFAPPGRTGCFSCTRGRARGTPTPARTTRWPPEPDCSTTPMTAGPDTTSAIWCCCCKD